MIVNAEEDGKPQAATKHDERITKVDVLFAHVVSMNFLN